MAKYNWRKQRMKCKTSPTGSWRWDTTTENITVTDDYTVTWTTPPATHLTFTMPEGFSISESPTSGHDEHTDVASIPSVFDHGSHVPFTSSGTITSTDISSALTAIDSSAFINFDNVTVNGTTGTVTLAEVA